MRSADLGREGTRGRPSRVARRISMPHKSQESERGGERERHHHHSSVPFRRSIYLQTTLVRDNEIVSERETEIFELASTKKSNGIRCRRGDIIILSDSLVIVEDLLSGQLVLSIISTAFFRTRLALLEMRKKFNSCPRTS